jgi:protein-S-isoprenylcysteine O-methyltransferase Ste14
VLLDHPIARSLGTAALVLAGVCIIAKIRIEEAYLRQAHGVAYATYCARTGRYLPRLRAQRRR